MLIKCSNLSIGYENKKILENVNFEIDKGDYLVIVGDNGAGKSTLIKTILGLIKPLKGKILFNNLKSNQIGYLPQIATNKDDFPASVYEVVISGCLNNKRFSSFYNKKDHDLANNNIKKFNLEKVKKNNFKELSGGQQQRVLLARALCALSKVLILDEPTTSLDKKSSASLYELIKKINDEGITIIMISHDLDNALKDANKVIETRNHEINSYTQKEYLKKGDKHVCNH